jgi:hypothetical protein
MDIYFDILRKNNIVSRRGVNRSVIDSLSAAQIIDLAQGLKEAIEVPTRNPSKTIFSHSTSSGLSGGRELCDSLDCRLGRLDELARFALLYSDQVYIHNYFSDYEHYRDSDISESELREHFYQDVFLTVEYKPVFEKGYIIPFTPPEHICQSCLAGSFLGHDAEWKLQKGYKWLAKDIFEHTSLYLELHENGWFCLKNVGTRQYFDHFELSQLLEEMPGILASRPKTVAKVMRGESVPIGKTVQKRLKIHNELAALVVNNIAYEISKTQALNTSLLTGREFYGSFLSAISDASEIENRNSAAMQHLSSIVPFVQDVEIKDLLKLRQRETLAFESYRRSLNEAIGEFLSRKTAFSEREAKTLYSDVIAPGLSSLEGRVQEAKRHLRIQPIRSTLALVGVIAFGLYTGFIPTEMVEIAKLLGLARVSMDIQKEVLSLSDAEKTIRSEDLYFLWRVQNKARMN